MTLQQLQRAQEKSTKQEEDGLAPFAADPSVDVQFFIGQKATGRDQSGIKTQRSQVSLKDFESWCHSALFLQDANDEMIKTQHGDLLTGSDFRGDIYLKGLLLKDSMASCESGMLRYGYNFLDGATNRDRQSMASIQHRCQQIFNIWGCS